MRCYSFLQPIWYLLQLRSRYSDLGQGAIYQQEFNPPVSIEYYARKAFILWMQSEIILVVYNG